MSFEETDTHRSQVNELLVDTFNSVLRIEEDVLKNRLTEGLTISEIHAIHAIGLHGESPMNVIAARLCVTLATCTVSVGKLVDKGFAQRARSKTDRRQVLVSLTKRGREAYRVHELFHKQMIDAAFVDLSEEEEAVFARSMGKVKAFFDAQLENREK